MPTPSNSWPELSWTVGANPAGWLVERTRLMAQRARAFELGLEHASADGAAALSKAAETLDEWEHAVANVWMYAGLGAASQVGADDVPFHAEELAKTWRTLGQLRDDVLQAVGADGAKAVAQHEAAAQVDDADIKERAGELPDFTQTSKLGVVTSTFAALQVAQPVTPDELKSRNAAEAKPLPAGADLKACLAVLPPPWVAAVFETLGIPLPMDADIEDEQELTANSRSALQRRAIADALKTALLQEVVYALADDDRQALGALVKANGALRYAELVTQYGRDDADGFHWTSRPPSGPLARLRRTGLGYVGMRDGKQVVAVPADLLPALAKLLE